MQRRPKRRPLHDTWKKLAGLFKREPESPDDPFALVGAPKKPRPPRRSAAAAEPLD
jgi:hypothetical protein